MANFTLRFKSEDAEFALRQLRASVPQGITRSLNRAAVSARAVMSTEVARDLGIKVGPVKDAIRIEEASSGQEHARVITTGARIPLIAFGARGPEPSHGRGRGVTAKIQGVRKTYPRAFITHVGQHRGVFQRRGRGRLPIAELHGPSVPHVFSKYADVGLKRGEETLITNLQHELRRAVRG